MGRRIDERAFSAAVDYAGARRAPVRLVVCHGSDGHADLSSARLRSDLERAGHHRADRRTLECISGFTLQNIVLGLVLGCVAGIALAYVMTRFPKLAVWLDGPLVILQTAPKIALAPLFVVWFGFGALKDHPDLLAGVFPVFIGAVASFRTLDPKMKDLRSCSALAPFNVPPDRRLPAAMPEIFVGLKIGAVQALVGAVLAEWMAGKVGLDILMTFAAATYKTPLLFAAVLMTVVLGLLCIALTVMERELLSWKGAKNG